MSNEDVPLDPPSDSADWELLARYSADECSPEEAAQVRRWLESRPAELAIVETLRQASDRLSFSAPTGLDVEAALRDVTARIDAADGQSKTAGDIRSIVAPRRQAPPVPVTSHATFPARGWTLAALAAAAGIAGIAVLTLRSRATRATDDRSANKTVEAVASLGEPRVYTTTVAGRDSIQLPDGSRAILGPRSRIVVPADYGQSRRSVDIQGVAYFDVRHDAAKPFTVHIANAVIEDVGTRFSAEEDASGAVQVAVVAGAVKLRSQVAGQSEIQLAAGDRGELNAGGTAHAYRGAEGPDDVAWMDGRLVFRDAAMPQVVADLSRWYGVTLVADSSLAGRHVKADFHGEPLSQVLQVLKLELPARVETRGDTVILHSARIR